MKGLVETKQKKTRRDRKEKGPGKEGNTDVKSIHACVLKKSGLRETELKK